MAPLILAERRSLPAGHPHGATVTALLASPVTAERLAARVPPLRPAGADCRTRGQAAALSPTAGLLQSLFMTFPRGVIRLFLNSGQERCRSAAPRPGGLAIAE